MTQVVNIYIYIYIENSLDVAVENIGTSTKMNHQKLSGH